MAILGTTRRGFLRAAAAGACAIRKGNLKLIEFFDTGAIELYDLAKDPSEQHNLAGEWPENRRDLLEALHDWQRRAGVTHQSSEKAYDSQ